MAAPQQIAVTTPIGRIVMGNLYRGSDRDSKGQPYIYKTGSNVGQPYKKYFFAVAVPKTPGQTWFQSDWGQQILAVAAAAFPKAYQRPTFAWKIEDGDSAELNGNDRRNCDREGFPGNWIIKFSPNYAPKIYGKAAGLGGWVELHDEDAVKPGYFAQVNFSISGNGSDDTPGVFLNTNAVAFIEKGEEIKYGPTVDEMGFSDTAKPLTVQAPTQSAGQMAAAFHAPSAPLVGTVVQPNPAFLAGPNPTQGIAPQPPAPPVPPTPAVPSPSKMMTAKAAGATYEQFTAQGWSDAQMIAAGYLQA